MFRSTLLACLLFATGTVGAADPITDAMQAAYSPYRVALFKTNSNAQADALQAIQQAQQSWRQIAARFSTEPSPPYDRDEEFARSLEKLDQIYAKAEGQITHGELSEAHETLEHARDLIADIRHRNNVITYSDHMNAYHAQMEAVLNKGSQTQGTPDGILALMAQTGALEYLVVRLQSEAPPTYLKNDEFIALFKAVEKSVMDLKGALLGKDPVKIKEALARIKAPYSKMFIKFG